MPVTVKLTREGFGIELRRGLFDVLVDGNSVGSIEYGKTVEVRVLPGRRTLRIRHGRYSSRALAFDAADGTTASFRCHGAMVWPRWLASFVKPDLAISLMRE